MCELLGFSLAKPVDVREYISEFHKHNDKNPHGWGIMFEDNGRQIIREPLRADMSETAASVIKTIPPQKNMLAHIRFATMGSIDTENCHPFSASDISGREWTLIHNGTIFSSVNSYSYASRQKGSTDSERLFLYMMDTINREIRHGCSTERDRFEVVNDFIVNTAPRNKLNLMIFDGELLYIHKNLKNTLFYRRMDEGFIFSTYPLDRYTWIPFPMAQVTAYKNGSAVYHGRQHKGIFVPTIEYIKAADAMYI